MDASGNTTSSCRSRLICTFTGIGTFKLVSDFVKSRAGKLASVLCRYNAVCADNFRCFQTDFSRSLNNAESGSFSKLFQRFKLF